MCHGLKNHNGWPPLPKFYFGQIISQTVLTASNNVNVIMEKSLSFWLIVGGTYLMNTAFYTNLFQEIVNKKAGDGGYNEFYSASVFVWTAFEHLPI